jgi:hypothetical protein
MIGHLGIIRGWKLYIGRSRKTGVPSFIDFTVILVMFWDDANSGTSLGDETC